MIRGKTTRKVVYYVFKSLLAVSVLAVAAVGAMLPIDLDAPHAPKNSAIVWAVQEVQARGWLVLLVASVTTVIADAVSRYVGRPWVWSAIECVMGTLKSHAFTDSTGYHAHYHRATLFRRKRCKFWIWPWRGLTPWGKSSKGNLVTPCSGWMVPVARSGHTTQRTNALFLAPDDGDCVEGMAGQTWSVEEILIQSDLPQVDSDSSEQDIEEYAKLTWMSEQAVRDRIGSGKGMPRALCGIPIFVSNKPWGAVVLDSRRADGIKPPESNMVAFKITQDFLDNLLSK